MKNEMTTTYTRRCIFFALHVHKHIKIKDDFWDHCALYEALVVEKKPDSSKNKLYLRWNCRLKAREVIVNLELWRL